MTTDPFERAVAREKAEREARRSRHVALGFRWHLQVYGAVNLLLVAIWLLTGGPDVHPWPVYPALGWGIGLYFHWTYVRYRKRDVRERRALLEDE